MTYINFYKFRVCMIFVQKIEGEVIGTKYGTESTAEFISKDEGTYSI